MPECVITPPSTHPSSPVSVSCLFQYQRTHATSRVQIEPSVKFIWSPTALCDVEKTEWLSQFANNSFLQKYPDLIKTNKLNLF